MKLRRLKLIMEQVINQLDTGEINLKEDEGYATNRCSAVGTLRVAEDIYSKVLTSQGC